MAPQLKFGQPSRNSQSNNPQAKRDICKLIAPVTPPGAATPTPASCLTLSPFMDVELAPYHILTRAEQLLGRTILRWEDTREVPGGVIK